MVAQEVLPRLERCGYATHLAKEAAMLTHIERVVIGVTDLQHAMHAYARLGFELHSSAESALAFNAQDCLELVPIPAGDVLVEGLRSIVIESDDLADDVRAIRARGIDISEVMPPRGGQAAASAELGPSNPLPLRFIQRAPAEGDRPHVCAHPNQVERLDGVNIVVPNVLAVVDTYAQVFGLPVPPLQPGTVIKASMCLFKVGPVSIGVVQPFEPGAAAAALESRGPGPFQVLFHTRGMRAGATWMETHGVPPPAPVTRPDGQQAMLVGPEQACGTYLTFVGPE
jgi:hypothetical protein